MTPTARTLSLLLALGLLGAAPDARQGGVQSSQPPSQQNPPQNPQQDPQQPPVIRTGINFVRVDVIVTDNKGEAVLDLKPEDFVVEEDGKAQKIESFTLIKVDPVAQAEVRQPEIRSVLDEEREAARPDVRLFVILLDDYHVRRGNDMAVREPLMRFIQNQLAPADMVALMYPLTPVSDIRFSRNRDTLMGAIKQFEGRKFNYEPRNMFEEQYAYYPAATVERIRNQVSMSALEAACMQMGALREGRKSIIYVSEGFTTVLPTQLNDPVAALPGLRNPNRGNVNAPQADDRTRMMAQSDVNYDMRRVFDTCNRQNTSIYPVDPRGLAVFEYGINEGVSITADADDLRSTLDTLHVLANNTDGRAIVNRNDLDVGMRQILRDSSSYYLIGYNSSEAPTDGKFHEIKVNVKRRGVSVRARKGYWALTAEDAARATAPPKPEVPSAVAEALTSLVEPPGGRRTRHWIGATRGENGTARMTFVWEAVPPPAGARESASQAARVMLTAVSEAGNPLFRGRIQPDAALPASTPPRGVATFDAPPGPLQLRIVYEGKDGEVVDSTVRELTVPDFTTVDVSLATPQVYRARTPKEIQTLRAGQGAIPTTDRTFSRIERLLIRTEAYSPGDAVEVTARLLNRAGESMMDVPVSMSGATAEIDLSLSPLAAAEYVLELNAKNASGSTAQELVAFRIVR